MAKKILLVGRWGKTHALAKAIKEKSVHETELYCYMDKPNAGLVPLATDYMLGDMQNNDKILSYVRDKKVDFAIVVPHMSLSNSISEKLIENGIPCIGPTRNCSRLETSKTFLRQMLKETNQDVSPGYHVFNKREDATAHINSIDYDFAVKPAGVTEGDGVKVIGIQLKDKQDAIDYVYEVFDMNIGGVAEIIIEEKLIGPEFTIQAFVDGSAMAGMPAIRDYKLLYEGEKGLNTPGMGSVSMPNHMLPFLSRDEYNKSIRIMKNVVDYTNKKFKEDYVGFLSGQFIKTADGIKVIEFNVRPGDSEIMNITPILKTDFVDLCEAMLDNKLQGMDVEFEKKATVCKYVVKEGFPYPKGNMEMIINDEAIKNAGADLFYSCFAVDDNIYKPSPRGVAVTAKGDSLEEAYLLSEKLIEENIKGKNIWHRKDIGTMELLDIEPEIS
ncbi:MAG: phosphoribosylamine--glycine ligase [Candidatus Kapaibacterium sp.]